MLTSTSKHKSTATLDLVALAAWLKLSGDDGRGTQLPWFDFERSSFAEPPSVLRLRATESFNGDWLANRKSTAGVEVIVTWEIMSATLGLFSNLIEWRGDRDGRRTAHRRVKPNCTFRTAVFLSTWTLVRSLTDQLGRNGHRVRPAPSVDVHVANSSS